MKTIALVPVLLINGLAALGAHAADVEQGERLARQWCSGCHVIGAQQSAGGDAAPPFAMVAETAAERSDDLRAWLADPHPPMPNFNLTISEIDDLVAYIESLKVE